MEADELQTWLNGTDPNYEREKIPENCDENWRQIIKSCWIFVAENRPSASNLVSTLQKMIQEHVQTEKSEKPCKLLLSLEILDDFIYPKKKDLLAFNPPYLTNFPAGPIENYWKEIEQAPITRHTGKQPFFKFML